MAWRWWCVRARPMWMRRSTLKDSFTRTAALLSGPFSMTRRAARRPTIRATSPAPYPPRNPEPSSDRPWLPVFMANTLVRSREDSLFQALVVVALVLEIVVFIEPAPVDAVILLGLIAGLVLRKLSFQGMG